MSKNKRWRLKVFILFVLSISVCFLLNLIPINQVQSQVVSTNTQTFSRGEDYFRSRQYDKAISLWVEALKSAPTDQVKANIHNNLASAYQLSGNLSEAVRQWEQGLKFIRKNQTNSRA